LRPSGLDLDTSAQSDRLAIKEAGNRLLVEVRDDGQGFDPDRTTRGAGIQNMEDRFDALGGQLDIDSAPGRGTRLSGWLPLNA